MSNILKQGAIVFAIVLSATIALFGLYVAIIISTISITFGRKSINQ